MPGPFPPQPKAVSPLEVHRVMAPTAGIRVSPLCLGAMNFGDAWTETMGKCDKKTAFEMLDFFHHQGGNFIDTTKSLRVSLEDSLKKLQTDYVDILYVHWWDFTTSVPELMQSLNTMVNAGKVLYLGVSDTPAWVVSKANEYARSHCMRGFSVYQGRWSAAARDFERDIIPMAREEGMALCPWGVLGAGNFTTEEKRKANEQGRNIFPASPAQIAISKKLEAIAMAKGTQITSIALAYVRHKYPYVYPVVGGRKVEHLKGNIEALGLELSDDEVDEIESAVPFDVGFPMNMLFTMQGGTYKTSMTSSDIGLLKLAGPIQSVPVQQGVKPAQL